MPRGRKPQADQALSNAPRQARYRARRAAAKPLPAIPFRRPIRPPSRPQRWHAAVAELIALQAEFAAWYDALPESLQSSPTAEALRAIVDLDLDELTVIDPPRGYGRD
jgi:hypothetical protein